MDIQMERAGMIRIALNDFLNHTHYFRCSFVWLAIPAPVTPGPQVHHRFRVERSGVEVFREALVYFAHRRRIGFVARSAFLGLAGVTLCECVDISLLTR